MFVKGQFFVHFKTEHYQDQHIDEYQDDIGDNPGSADENKHEGGKHVNREGMTGKKLCLQLSVAVNGLWSCLHRMRIKLRPE